MAPVDEQITPQPWLAVPRQHPIQLIVIHSTRGDTIIENQYAATMNWLQSPDNRDKATGGWGGSTNRLIGCEGEMCICWPDDMSPTYSAGFGFNNTDWAIDWYAISFELVQRRLDEDFREATLARAAREVAALCQKYNIPPVWLDRVDQSGPPPSGITGHENTDNGRKLGKSDPGSISRGGRFDPDDFIRRVRQEMNAPAIRVDGAAFPFGGGVTSLNGIATVFEDAALLDGQMGTLNAHDLFPMLPAAGVHTIIVELFRKSGRVELFHGDGTYAGQVGWGGLPYLQMRLDLDPAGKFSLRGLEGARLQRLGLLAYA